MINCIITTLVYEIVVRCIPSRYCRSRIAPQQPFNAKVARIMRVVLQVISVVAAEFRALCGEGERAAIGVSHSETRRQV
jgi:hypothetical protein